MASIVTGDTTPVAENSDDAEVPAEKLAATIVITQIPKGDVEKTRGALADIFMECGDLERIILQEDDATNNAVIVFQQNDAAVKACQLAEVKVWGKQVSVMLAASLGNGGGTDASTESGSGGGGNAAPVAQAHAVPDSPQQANALIHNAKSLTAMLLAQGYLLGKMGLESLQSLDEKNGISSRVVATAKQLDEKLQVRATAASIDEQYKVSELTSKSIKGTQELLSNTATTLHTKAMKSNTYKSGFGMLKRFGAKVSKEVTSTISLTKEEIAARSEAQEGGQASAAAANAQPPVVTATLVNEK